MPEKTSENAGDRDSMMRSMMEMMPKVMFQCGVQDFGKMQDMIAKMKGGDPEARASQMPEMMLKMVVPHCIEMMMPKIEPNQRGDVAAEILSKIVSKGSDGMSDEQTRAFLEALEDILNPSR